MFSSSNNQHSKSKCILGASRTETIWPLPCGPMLGNDCGRWLPAARVCPRSNGKQDTPLASHTLPQFAQASRGPVGVARPLLLGVFLPLWMLGKDTEPSLLLFIDFCDFFANF